MMDTLTKVVTGFTAIGLLGFVTHWARPTLRASRATSSGKTWGWLQSVLNSIETFLDHGTNYVAHHVSKGAAHAAAGPAHTLNVLALRWEQSIWNIAWLASDLEYVVGRIVHHVIPAQINHQTVPMRARIRRLRVGIATLTHDLNALRHWITHELNHNVKPRIGRVETKVNHTLPSRIRRGERLQARTQARVKQQGRWIGKLLPLLTIAGAASLVLRALPRLGLNYIKCQNVKDVGNELCASPPGSGKKLGRFLRGLFSGLGGLLAPLFICQLFQAAVVVVGPLMSKMIETVGFVGNALCDGEHQAAPPLVLHVTADPPVPNPLAL
jgi:hypothetical protein